MNARNAMFARRYRKNHKRGVSPIIATILLVAITVVLAAVLYVLISGLVHGPGNTPIGSALGLGGATLFSGTAAQVGCAAATDYCYKVLITSVSSSITVGSISLQVKATTGAVYPGQSATSAVTITTISGAALVSSVVGANPINVGTGATYAWAAGSGTTASILVTSDTLWIDLGAVASSPAGSGLTLVIFGNGAFSGSETVALP
jgi:flagellin-like protein